MIFTCNDCGAQFPKWSGQCGDCGAWNSIIQEALIASKANARQVGYSGQAAVITSLSDVELVDDMRIKTFNNEFDRVLGGGLTAGSVVLLGGDPGIGKSTLLLQVMMQLATQMPALYVTGEESLQQVTQRASRLQLAGDQLQLLADTQVERIIAAAEKVKPKVMVIDSVQTIFTDVISSAPGSVSQLRESAAKLITSVKIV